jgi:hypothetical protein
MQKQDILIEDFSSRILTSRRITKFDLLYKGIEVEGTCVESFSDMYSDYDCEVIIESDDLSDDDIAYIEDYVRDTLSES